MRPLLFLIMLLSAAQAWAENDRLVTIGTRPGATVSFYYMKRPAAKVSVVLLNGGGGNIGLKNGIPTSKNFLVRSRGLFAAKGFNVAVVDRPSDTSDLDGSFRTSQEHMQDLSKVINYLKNDENIPVWLVGTSMGTISAASAAISSRKDEISGIVLTSSITSRKKIGALPWLKLEDIIIPVLVLHHEFDECKSCVPGDIAPIFRRLVNSPTKKEIYVKGGSIPTGDPCQPLHRHGFIGLETEVVDIISEWILTPVP